MLHAALLALTLVVGAQDTLLVQPIPGFNKQIVAYVTDAHLMIVIPGSPDTLHFQARHYTSFYPAAIRDAARCEGQEPGFLADSVQVRAWVRDSVLFRGTLGVPRSLVPRERLLVPLRGKGEPVLEMFAVDVPLSPCGNMDGTVFFTFGVHRKESQVPRSLNSRSISGDELRRGGSLGVEGILQARFPGVVVHETVGGILFAIRGKPALCVIDGVQLRMAPRPGLCPVIPNDIETLEILTDPIALGIYGVNNGEAGVVRITTRLR